MNTDKDYGGWHCPVCGRWEDGTGPCAHTRPKEDATVSWLREDLKRANQWRPSKNGPSEHSEREAVGLDFPAVSAVEEG